MGRGRLKPINTTTPPSWWANSSRFLKKQVPVAGHSALLDALVSSNAFEPTISRFPTPVFSSDKILITHNYVEGERNAVK
jgi:hypothetical protein